MRISGIIIALLNLTVGLIELSRGSYLMAAFNVIVFVSMAAILLTDRSGPR